MEIKLFPAALNYFIISILVVFNSFIKNLFTAKSFIYFVSFLYLPFLVNKDFQKNVYIPVYMLALNAEQGKRNKRLN